MTLPGKHRREDGRRERERRTRSRTDKPRSLLRVCACAEPPRGALATARAACAAMVRGARRGALHMCMHMYVMWSAACGALRSPMELWSTSPAE